MALIHVYNSVTNEHSSIKGTGKLKNILPDYDFSHCIALSKGNRINGDYYAGENEIIYLLTVPSSCCLCCYSYWCWCRRGYICK